MAGPPNSLDGADAVSSRYGALRAELLELVRSRGYERRDEPFLLSSGGMSRDYVDLRRAFSRGADLRLAGEAVAVHLESAGIVFDAIGGLTMGADPVAHAVAIVTGKSWFSVRKSEKQHGAKRRIEGAALGPGVRAVCFEDTTSTGRSALEALEAVAGTGADVVAVCAILDRGAAAQLAFAERGVRFTSLLEYRDLGIEAIGPSGEGSPELSPT